MLTANTPATIPRRAMILGGAAVLLASPGLAQGGGGGGGRGGADDGTQGDRMVEIRNLARQTQRALEAGNIDLLDSYLADDYLCIDVTGNAIDKRARLKQLKEAGLKLSAVESENQSVRLYDQTVIVTGQLDVKGNMNGRDIAGRYRYLDVWLRRDGKWTAIASTMTRVLPSPAPPAAAAPAR